MTTFFQTLTAIGLAVLSASPMAAQPRPLYQEASQPVEVRVNDLLGRMTLEEKIAQLRHIHAYSIVDNGQLNYEKLEQLLYGPCDGRTACTDSADTKRPEKRTNCRTRPHGRYPADCQRDNTRCAGECPTGNHRQCRQAESTD